MSALVRFNDDCGTGDSQHVFEAIAADLLEKGYSIKPNALPTNLLSGLWQQLRTMPGHQFDPAGVGRQQAHTVNNFIRSDAISWIERDTPAGEDWLNWAAELQQYLNRRLFLGLFSFESHFSHYAPGDFYKKHLDAFKGQSNRMLSVVLYLNPDWMPDDGGELALYHGDQSHHGERSHHGEQSQSVLKVTPSMGTLVAFLSEEFPHEVLPAKRDRYAIAGWFRVNTTSTGRADPPD
ncbi:SM-20-related protein [Marinobacter sp. LV10R520-4]|uniref:2OG-Fe(II) oxygenase n=1 Tax=Marinobacter sp. LV10R520-4 TaxID=1761796 RepID=UPI000BF5452A|nr:2OG-Fe(II) oxygenase [Marinobacter sp. LV10R520-4]PFG51957.1 SM-20-related protein [Marinobacter sp. LV10R520-4]